MAAARRFPLVFRQDWGFAGHGHRGRGARGGRASQLRLLPGARRAALTERGLRVLPAASQGAASRSAFSASAANRPRTTRAATSRRPQPMCRAPSPGSRPRPSAAGSPCATRISPQLNSLFRARPGPKQNLPVLDARSSQIMLVSNHLAPRRAQRESATKTWCSITSRTVAQSRRGQPAGPALGLGWDVTDDARQPGRLRGAGARSTTSGSTTRCSRRFRASGRPSSTSTAFSGGSTATTRRSDGKYPFSLWQPGDYIVDDHEFSLEPNFTPRQLQRLLRPFRRRDAGSRSRPATTRTTASTAACSTS